MLCADTARCWANEKRETASLQSPVWCPERDSSEPYFADLEGCIEEGLKRVLVDGF